MNQKLPCDECKGRCCTRPPMTKSEFKRIRKKYGVPKGTIIGDHEVGYNPSYRNMKRLVVPINPDTGDCPWLSDQGKCTVYDLRPLTCQNYGIHPEIPCEYLYPKKANAKMVEMILKS